MRKGPRKRVGCVEKEEMKHIADNKRKMKGCPGTVGWTLDFFHRESMVQGNTRLLWHV